MAEIRLAKLTSKGQMTIPRDLRDSLGLRVGEYVALMPVLGGIFISKASVRPQVMTDTMVGRIALEIERAAGEHSAPEGGDMDRAADETQGQMYEMDKGVAQHSRKIAELTLSYLGQKPRAGSALAEIQIDSHKIAQAMVDVYGTDDIVEIVNVSRGRGE